MSGFYVKWPPQASGSGGGGGGFTTVGSMDAQPASVNGASFDPTTIYMQSATGSNSGLVNISTQAFGGLKIFATAAPIMATLAGASPVFTTASGQLTSGSVSLTTQVVGNLPIQPGGNTSGSISLTSQVSGILPAANLPPLSGITGSVSLTSQVSGLLPLANMNLTVGPLDGATGSPNAATLGSNSLYMQSASTANPGIVSSAAQTFAGVKTFNGQIIAPAGIGLSALGTLSIGADVNSQFIVIGSGTFSRIGLNMNSPQGGIHWGAGSGNGNTTSGTVGSYSLILGRIHPSNNVGAGAVIIGGFTSTMTASGQGSVAIGDNGCRAEASFAVAIGGNQGHAKKPPPRQAKKARTRGPGLALTIEAKDSGRRTKPQDAG